MFKGCSLLGGGYSIVAEDQNQQSVLQTSTLSTVKPGATANRPDKKLIKTLIVYSVGIWTLKKRREGLEMQQSASVCKIRLWENLAMYCVMMAGQEWCWSTTAVGGNTSV